MTVLTNLHVDANARPQGHCHLFARPPGIFCCAKALGLGTHFGAKAPGCPGGMVTSQIDTCVTTITTCQTAANKQRQCLQLYSSRLYVTDCVHSGTLEYFLDERIEKCFINIFWLLSQAVKLRQHGIDCFL